MTDTAPPRRLEYLPLAELLPADRNAKDHDQDALAHSVGAFGFVEPVVLDERTGQLLAGHGRTEYLMRLEGEGQDPPEGVVVDDDGTWRAPVVRGVASTSDDHATAMGIALNRVGERGGWHMDQLAEQLDQLRLDDALFAATGFDLDHLEDMLALTGGAPSLDDLEDKYGEPDPAQLWPVLRFKVAPTVRDRYLRIVEGLEGGDDVLFDQLLTWAEQAKGTP
jgi:ParB-like chromosome segregation protein Spo0J